MAGLTRFEVPLTVEVNRSVIGDVTDNLTDSRTLVTRAEVCVEPETDISTSVARQETRTASSAYIGNISSRLNAVPVEEVTRAVLDHKIEDIDASVLDRKRSILNFVGREKAQSALGGLATGIFLAGGGAAVVEGFSEGKPAWFFGGLVVSCVSGAIAVGQRDMNQRNVFDKQPLEGEIDAFEEAASRKLLFNLIRDKLSPQKEQPEEVTASATEPV